MINFKHIIYRYPRGTILSLALVVIIVTSLYVVATLRGWPESAYDVEKSIPTELEPGDDIAGWSWFDKDSYFMGDEVTAWFRIVYREDVVEPNFDSFQNYVSFRPFEQQDVTSSDIDLGSGIKVYQLEYKLQAMGGKPSGAYAFNPAALYYKKILEQSDTLHSLRIQPPQVYVASYYPLNIAGINLLDIKSEIVEPVNYRQAFMLISGLILLGLSILLLWMYGRRRKFSELPVSEQLWRSFNEFRYTQLDNRTYLLKCERIFSGLLTGYVHVSPETFWSGTEVDYGIVAGITPKIREILQHIYQLTDPNDADVEEITRLLEDTLSSIVEEERLKTELEPTFITRLRKQPKLLMSSVFLIVISFIVLMLAYYPLLWQAPDIAKYNQLVPEIDNGIVVEDNPYDELSVLGESAEIGIVKAAAFYNAGTIRANQSFASTWLFHDEQRQQHEMVLNELFQPQSAESFLHNLSGPFFHTEDEIVVMLTNAAEHLLRAELNLQEAVRAQVDNEDIRRNLELITKRRITLLTRLAQIRDYYAEKDANREEDEMFSDAGLIDIINAKLPEEFDDEEARSDDRGYIIFERF